jgi:hypothetical protein
MEYWQNYVTYTATQHLEYGHSAVLKMQIILENKKNVLESGALPEIRLSRWEDQLSWAGGQGYLEYPICCAG